MKRRAENIINDFNTSESNQNADTSPNGIVKYTFDAEDEDEFHLVKNACYCRQSKASKPLDSIYNPPRLPSSMEYCK